MAAIAYPIPGRRPHLRVVPDLPTARPHRPGPATYRRRRAVALLVLAGGSLSAPETPAPAAVPGAPAAQVHVVQPGETLWGIARAMQSTGDVRELVDRLAAAHGGGALQVGDRIVLPR